MNYLEILKEENLLLWLALRHHRTHKRERLDFTDHLFLKDIYTDDSPYQVIIKSTQAGVSEYELVRSIAHALMGMNVFVVFPTEVLVGRFVNGRFNKSMQYTMYYKQLQKLIRENEEKRTDSMRMIDVGDGNICYVGSNSEANFTEYPADEVIIEELDQCDLKNIKMAKERLSHSKYRWQLLISNPTYEGMAIDEEYNDTDQMEWHIKADCGHWINLDWFEHVVKEIDKKRYIIRDTNWTWTTKRDISPICHICGKPINRRNDGEWIPGKPHNKKRGRRVTKLFSGTTSILEILTRFQTGLKDDSELQRVYNADFGKAYTPEGSKITRKMIQECVGDYAEGPEKGINIAGIDVGGFFNYVIKRVLPDGRLKTLKVGKERNTDTLIKILKEYKITAGIIDGLPETRESKKIASKFKLMFLCYFGPAKNDSIDLQRKTITVQRTPCLDAVKDALMFKTIIYPQNIMSNDEFVKQMTASTRVVNKEVKAGTSKVTVDWVEGSKDDHYFLATGYCLIAKRLLVLLQQR